MEKTKLCVSTHFKQFIIGLEIFLHLRRYVFHYIYKLCT